MTDYIIDKLVGKGSFGRVYLIKNELTGRKRVAKFMKITGFIPKETYDNEINILKKLSKKKCSEHILCLDTDFTYTSKAGNNYVVLITDYIDAISLREFLDKHMNKNLSSDDFLFIVYQLINTFNNIHTEYKITHKDIKPENILINPKTLKITVIDFGISCHSRKCSPGGTQMYMSPETLSHYNQHKPLSFKKSVQSDIFSLGIVLLELLGCPNYFNKTQSIEKVIELIPALIKKCPLKMIQLNILFLILSNTTENKECH